MPKIFLTIGSVLSAYGLLLFITANFNLGVILTILLGMFFLIYGIFYKKVNNRTKAGFGKYVKSFVIVILCAEIILTGFIAMYGQNDNVTYKEDAVIVLGAGIRGDNVTLPLKLRLDKAVDYHRKNPDALIVVTGGMGFQETVTEAYAMEKYLLNNGIDKNAIIKEERASSTNENMSFSKAILDNIFCNDYKIAVITNNFHIYRSVAIAKAEGFENVSHIHAGLQWYDILPCYLRENLAVLKMWVLD